MRLLLLLLLLPLLLLAACSVEAPVTRTYSKPAPAALAKKLTPLQWHVTQEADTEPPFDNAYWDSHDEGLFVDVVTGEPLFSSRDKFDSGTGWPSFARPVEGGRVLEHADNSYGMVRVEVVSNAGGSHLGHVFDDGPAAPVGTGKRFCINSASLRFIAKAQLAAEGYADYAALVGPSVVDGDPANNDNNACVAPAPGEKAGCATTIGSVVAKGEADAFSGAAGVLEVKAQGNGTVRVLFDPERVTREELARRAPLVE